MCVCVEGGVAGDQLPTLHSLLPSAAAAVAASIELGDNGDEDSSSSSSSAHLYGSGSGLGVCTRVREGVVQSYHNTARWLRRVNAYGTTLD